MLSDCRQEHRVVIYHTEPWLAKFSANAINITKHLYYRIIIYANKQNLSK